VVKTVRQDNIDKALLPAINQQHITTLCEIANTGGLSKD
jgi:hypothetical protein